MYDPLVVDAFVRFHAQGGLSKVDSSVESSGASAATVSLRPNRTGPVARPLEDISASGEEMLVLFDLARALADSGDLFQIGESVVKHLRRIVPSSVFVFYLHDPDAGELISSYTSGDQSGMVAGLRIPLGLRLTGWVGAHRQSIRNSDPVFDLGDAARVTTPRLRSCLSTPLIAGEALVGVLTLYCSIQEAFSEDHQRIVEAVARQISPVVQQASIRGHRHARSLSANPISRRAEESGSQGDAAIDLPVAIILVSLIWRDEESRTHAGSEATKLLLDLFTSRFDPSISRCLTRTIKFW